MLTATLISRILDHLLAEAEWARMRLHPFAGQVLRLELGPVRLTFSITAAGGFAAASADATPQVCISLPTTPLDLLQGPERLLQQARVSGNADFAETLSFVFRHLEWDVEAELAPWLGDILAHRIARSGRALKARLSDHGRRLAEQCCEYLRDEIELLTPRQRQQGFATDLLRLRDDLARLEKRVQRLEHG
ncbi:MAG: hypothetical protein N3C59_03475 [Azovibrio sp.]|nr:hypothetical protein [Azovibrio sp.]